MKSCPSCNEALADDATACECGYRFEEGVSGLEDLDLGESGKAADLKRCVMCHEVIARDAIKCKHCGSMVSLWEGSVYGQFFVLLFANLWILWGCFLPWLGNDFAGQTKGIYALPGAIVAFLAFGGVCASLYSICTKRLFFWPTLLAFFMAGFFCIVRFVGVSRANPDAFSGLFFDWFTQGWRDRWFGVYNLFGAGYYVVFSGSIFILVFMVKSVLSGAKEAKAKKQARQQARAASRRAGR